MAVKHTRGLAAALHGDYGDYTYDKTFKRGPAGRSGQRRARRVVTKRARALRKLETQRIVRDESC